jgi:hypothetical protein
MAVDATQIQSGAAVVSVGDWVTAGSAGSLTDVGHMKGPVSLTPSFEDYEIKSERAFGTLKRVPISGSLKLAMDLQEVTAEHMRIAMRQPDANLTGTSPDQTLNIGDFTEQYHQVTVVVTGPGTTNVRTLTLWKGYMEALGAIPFAKGEEQHLAITFDCLYDDSVTSTAKFGKIVDT